MKPSDNFKIFRYRDINELIRDLIIDIKHQNSVFTLEFIQRKINSLSASQLRMVVTNKRVPNLEMIKNFCQFFELDDKECSFLCLLRSLKKTSAEDPTYQFILEKLEEFKVH